jgi:hypothetical protein
VTDVPAAALAEALRDRYRLERELGREGMVLHPEFAAGR